MSLARTVARCVVAVLAPSLLPAQIGPPIDPYRLLQKAFDASVPNGPTLVLAVQQGFEPLLRFAGSDGKGAALTPQTLWPLGPLARVLVADAMRAELRGDLSAVALQVGVQPVRIGELLAGSAFVPDCFAWNGGATFAPDVLRACAEFALGTGSQFPTSTSGLGDLVLLRERALGQRHPDWPSYLRSHLGAQAPGLEPIDCRTLDAAQQALMPFPRGAQHDLTKAEPDALRLLLSGKSLAAWWQWRAGAGLEGQAGRRLGHQSKLEGRGGAGCWQWYGRGPGFWAGAVVYPSRKAALLCLGSDGKIWQRVAASFDTDVFGEAEEQPSYREAELVDDGDAPALADLAQSQWRTAATALGVPLQLAIGDGSARSVVLTMGEMARTGQIAEPAGSAFAVAFLPDRAGMARTLWLWPQGEGNQVPRLRCVLLEHSATQSVPQLFVLERVTAK